ncbi:MAG: adenylyltransferase/cytidyltransferase family protein, partial [Patescibacteria group bacterium]
MSIIEFKDIASLRKEHKDKKIVFCSGTFDLTHAGHVLFLEDCKKYGDLLVVAVGNDFNQRVNAKGKGRPVQNEHLRLKMVSSLKPVDYALLDINAKDGDILALL